MTRNRRTFAVLTLMLMVGSVVAIAVEGDDRNYLNRPVKRGLKDLELKAPNLDGLPPIDLPDSGKEDELGVSHIPMQMTVPGPIGDSVELNFNTGGSALVGPAGGMFMSPKMRADREIRKISRALR